MKQFIEYAFKHKVIKNRNKIIEKSLETSEVEDKTIRNITKEFTDFILRLIKS